MTVNTVLIHTNQRTGYMCTKEANTAEVTQHCAENILNGLAKTQTHEEIQTLWQIQGYEESLEIQNTIQKRAK